MHHVERDEEMRWVAAVAATLRAERGVAALSQAEAGRRAGIARTSYRLYEEGKRQPDVVQVARICEAFGIPVPYFVSEVARRAAE